MNNSSGLPRIRVRDLSTLKEGSKPADNEYPSSDDLFRMQGVFNPVYSNEAHGTYDASANSSLPFVTGSYSLAPTQNNNENTSNSNFLSNIVSNNQTQNGLSRKRGGIKNASVLDSKKASLTARHYLLPGPMPRPGVHASIPTLIVTTPAPTSHSDRLIYTTPSVQQQHAPQEIRNDVQSTVLSFTPPAQPRTIAPATSKFPVQVGYSKPLQTASKMPFTYSLQVLQQANAINNQPPSLTYTSIPTRLNATTVTTSPTLLAFNPSNCVIDNSVNSVPSSNTNVFLQTSPALQHLNHPPSSSMHSSSSDNLALLVPTTMQQQNPIKTIIRQNNLNNISNITESTQTNKVSVPSAPLKEVAQNCSNVAAHFKSKKPYSAKTNQNNGNMTAAALQEEGQNCASVAGHRKSTTNSKSNTSDLNLPWDAELRKCLAKPPPLKSSKKYFRKKPKNSPVSECSIKLTKLSASDYEKYGLERVDNVITVDTSSCGEDTSNSGGSQPDTSPSVSTPTLHSANFNDQHTVSVLPDNPIKREPHESQSSNILSTLYKPLTNHNRTPPHTPDLPVPSPTAAPGTTLSSLQRVKECTAQRAAVPSKICNAAQPLSKKTISSQTHYVTKDAFTSTTCQNTCEKCKIVFTEDSGSWMNMFTSQMLCGICVRKNSKTARSVSSIMNDISALRNELLDDNSTSIKIAAPVSKEGEGVSTNKRSSRTVVESTRALPVARKRTQTRASKLCTRASSPTLSAIPLKRKVNILFSSDSDD